MLRTKAGAQRKLLADLSDLLNETERLVRRAGGPEGYLLDAELMLAGEAIMHRLGEIAKRLPREFKSEHSDVPWREITVTRNVVAHEYERVDHRILWGTLSIELPRIRNALADRLPLPRPLLPLGKSSVVTTAPTARREGGSRQTATCGKWMPKARRRCVLPPRHQGHCRSA